MKSKQSKIASDENDWVLFAQSFLLLARLGCQELTSPEPRHNKNVYTKGSFPYKKTDLYVAIVFNIKHGIEVFIKALNFIVYGENMQLIHDINKLFQDFRQKFGNKSMSEELTYLNEIEELIIYFYKLEFLKLQGSSSKEVKDIKNDMFRYPDNRANISFYWESIVDQINESDIKDIQSKADRLYSLFNTFLYTQVNKVF